MAKISPVSIKYMIVANFTAEGALEKPDVIGAIFGQTEGLLGADLEMRELQKEGKIGRIEVDIERKGKRTIGIIRIPTALDQSETTLIGAAIETIERIGPSDAQIEIEKIEDVRGNKREYIIERAKKLMREIKGSIDSREISKQVSDDSKMSGIISYGKENLPAGDISGKELIVVEGRADVLNLMRNGVKNVIAMNGTKLPETIRELSEEKEITLFVDGDRGGRLIARNVVDNAKVSYITIAPDGKEVEELSGKEILMKLRKKVSPGEFFSDFFRRPGKESKTESKEEVKIGSSEKEKLKEIFVKNKGKGKAVILDKNFEEIKKISGRNFRNSLNKIEEKVHAIVIDGTATKSMMDYAEETKCQIIVAKNFATTDTSIKLLSL
ncbi:MAG: DNA primase [Nanoarchaeota archaeon]|nr:DNA primase [Nanoarchaeota archaeon]